MITLSGSARNVHIQKLRTFEKNIQQLATGRATRIILNFGSSETAP